MIQGETEDPTTRAVILSENWRSLDGERVKFDRLIDTVAFSYSSDILQLGDPFSVTIPNPKGEYTSRFQRGSGIKLYLKNPNVNGGDMTLKHTGIIVRRTASCTKQGSIIQLDCADLGWHLVNNDAPLWYKLQYGTFEKLLKDDRFIDPSWGIRGFDTSNEINSLIRQGKRNGRAGATFEVTPTVLVPVVQMQVEPGDKVADKIIEYARRINVLVNMSADGRLVLFRPDCNQAPKYTINFHGFDESNRTLNDVIEVHAEEDISTIYTEVTCIGEIVGSELANNDPNDQNAGKRRGTFYNLGALPFKHRVNFADGEIFSHDSARKQAGWFFSRGIFDSWQATYVVRGHHQGGNWWESDTMCTLNDSVNGHEGTFYVSAVRCDRSERGDITTVTLRKPGLLQASFGVLPRAPKIKYSPPNATGTATESSNTTKVTENK